jgi:CubicO group peptidase (beta-lactamase class C family)
MKPTAMIILIAISALSFAFGQNVQNNYRNRKSIRAVEKTVISNTSPKLSNAEIVKNVEAYLKQKIAADKFSGAVLIAKDNVPIFKKAYGLANRASNIQNRTDTKFNLGSMNKMFTAVGIAQLAEQGKLSFDDRISKHLPDYPNKAVAEKVTIHHLLTHTSGLGDYFGKKFEEASRAKFRTVQDYFPLFVNDPLAFEPGQKWEYSNAGFIVLGAIIEKVSGQSYFDYVKEHIYRPAGMENTDAYEMDVDTPNLAIGYTNRVPREMSANGQRRNNLFMQPIKGGPAGGGYSTVDDLLRFATALLRNKLLSQKYTEILLTGKISTPRRENEKYAYGFFEETVNGQRRVGHGGAFAGTNSELYIYPSTGYTVAVMSNYDPPAATLIANRSEKLITGIPVPIAIKLDVETLQKFAGIYEAETGPTPRGTFRVTLEGEDIWVATSPRSKHKLLPMSEAEFFDEDFDDIRFKFGRDSKGNITGLEMSGNGHQLTMRKLPVVAGQNLPNSSTGNFKLPNEIL